MDKNVFEIDIKGQNKNSAIVSIQLQNDFIGSINPQEQFNYDENILPLLILAA